jgi:probable phosphomutase (TIGR03848 family)
MPLFLLVRHGENEYVKTGRLAGRLPGVHLNEKGRHQATLLVDQLAAAPIKAVYSSPLERTLETAEPLAQRLGLPVHQRPGLIECDAGEWQDQKIKALSRSKAWKTVISHPSLARFPGGESFAEAQTRIAGEILEITRLHGPKDMVLCVSHADPIKLAVAYFINLPLDMFQRLDISPGSITSLFIGEHGGRLLALNIEPERNSYAIH